MPMQLTYDIKIVGFRVGISRAVFNRTLKKPTETQMGLAMMAAFSERKCDFISVRRV